MEMNLEELNLRNMVWFYRDELIQIDNGVNAKNFFTNYYTSKLIKRKIIKLDFAKNGGRKHILTDETKDVLESMNGGDTV